jgi:cystathionine beta-lyase/cystathionine gamma-synthase
VVAGAICGSKKLIREIFNNEFLTLGGILSPTSAWLVLRGLRTLPLRLRHIEQTTKLLLGFLRSKAIIRRIYYPFLEENDQYQLAEKQMKNATGLFTIELDASVDSIENFCNNLSFWKMAVSWGGFESLVIPSCTFVRPGLYSTLPPNLIRFSTGLDDADSLINDLKENWNRLEK